MTQRISSSTVSNQQGSSVFVAPKILSSDRPITLLFPPVDTCNNNSSAIPNSSGVYSEGKTESIYLGNMVRDHSIRSFDQKKDFDKQSSSFSSDELRSEREASPEARRSLKKWRSISLMFKSIRGFQSNVATKLENIDSLDKIMEKFEPSNGKDNTKKRKNRTRKTEFENALDHILDIEKLIDCAERGGKEDLNIIRSIIEKDPRRYLISSMDPEHLINKKNRYGLNALYSASRNGHLNVFNFNDFVLIFKDCEFLKRIHKLEEGINENALEVAARWGHQEVVNYLIDNVEFSEKELKKCFSLAMTTELKQNLSQKMKKIQANERSKKKSNGFFDFLTNFCC